MQPADLVTKINRIFGEEDAALLISALRQDALVWNAIQDETLAVGLTQESKARLNEWTPAAIFCLSENIPSPADLKNLSLGLDGNIRQLSIQNYETVCRGNKPPKDLKQAGYAALALRERRKLVKSWDGLAEEMESNQAISEQEVISVWGTVISILAGIISDENGLFEEILGLPGKVGRELVSHAILSLPVSLKEKINVLSGLMIKLDLAGQIDWLQALALRGEIRLSEQLAKLLIANSASNLLNGFLATELSSLDLPQVAAKAVRLQQAATLYQLAGKEIEANRFLNSAADTISYLNTGIRLQQAGIQNVLPEKEGTGKRVSGEEITDNVAGLQGELLLAAAAGSSRISSKGLPGKFGRCFQELREAGKLVLSGELDRARGLAYPAIEAFMQFISSANSNYSPKFLINWQPEEFVELLVNLNYLKEAAVAAEWFLRYQPTNARLLGLLGDLFTRENQPERAAKSLSLAVSLNPNDSSNRRLLARLHETNGNYSGAMDEWKRIVDVTENSNIDDQMNLAKTAYRAEEYKQTFNICKTILEKDPFHGLACSYLGQSAAVLGDDQTANEFLQKSVLLAPDSSEVWLALSRYQKQKGELQKAYETLRSASASLPDSSEINLELALMSMETGRPSEALPHLRLAATIQPENLEVATLLINALLTLGHQEEARELLGNIRKRWPEDIDLAKTHGLLLQDAGQYRDAIAPLQLVNRKNPTDEDAAVGLCLSQLESKLDSLVVEGKPRLNINLAEIAQIISTLLGKNAESIRGHLILGALQYAMGNLDKAFDEFKAAAELSKNGDEDLHWIAQGGLGRTALALDKPEVALAVLDEATTANPKNITLQRLLVPAYLKANLPQEALITAQHALEMAPDDVENLVWYAQTMLNTGNREEAVKTIRKASDGLNGEADSLIKLAALGMNLDEKHAARKSLIELSTLPGVNPDDLVRASHIQMQLGDFSGAGENLSRAIRQTESSNPQWLFELACLQKNVGDTGAAQEAVKRALIADPLSSENWLIQADMFEEMGRHQSALECLEKAIGLIGDENRSAEKSLPDEMNSIFARYKDISKAEIHTRFSHLMYQIGNLTGALVHAEQALELEPQNLHIRLLATRLAEALLLGDRACTIAELPDEQAQISETEEISSDERDEAAEILSIKACRYLAEQKLAEAEEIYQKICRLSPNSFVKENIEIRLAAANGNLNEVKDLIDSHVVQHVLSSKKARNDLQLSGISIAAAEAALAVERWDLALKLVDQIVASHSLEPAAHLAYARALVRTAEEYVLRNELGLKKHLPSGDALNESHQNKFEAEITAAGKGSTSDEVSRWEKRGQLVFGGKAGLEKVAADELHNEEDQAAYLQALRTAHRIDDVISIGEKVAETPQILLQMALAYAEKNPRVGLDLCLHMNEIAKPSPVTLAVSARLAELSEEAGQAVDFLNQAMEQYPDESAWRAWLAALLEKQKDFDNATYHLEEAVAISPDSPHNWQALGKLYIKNKQNHQAIHAFSKAVELDPQNPDAMLSLASSYRAAGEIQDALDCIDKAIELNVRPENAFLLKGEISRDLGNLNDAVEFSKSALKANPKSQDAYLFLAQTQRVAGKVNDAVNTIEQAISTLGANVELLIEKAKIIHTFKGAREVLPFLQELASQFPKNGEILGMLAKVMAESGDLINAERTALESLKIQPHQPDLNLFVGKILRKSGQLDKAVHHFGQAVDQSHLDIEAVIELAQTHQEQREYEKALEAFQMAIQIAPRDIRAYTGAAAIYRESKDYNHAEEMLRRAAEIDPSNLSIRRQLGAVVALNLVHTTQEAQTLA
jgi:tetratricopeptide (TPR) repeat protein